MKAYIVQSRGNGGVAEIPEYKVKPDYIKIKTVAVALNPSIFDWHGCLFKC